MKHRVNDTVIAAMIIVVFNTGEVTVSVTVGDEGVIDWEPACRLFFGKQAGELVGQGVFTR